MMLSWPISFVTLSRHGFKGKQEMEEKLVLCFPFHYGTNARALKMVGNEPITIAKVLIMDSIQY